MNEIIKAMETRRSIRGYKEDMVPEELIAEVVKAGTYAATGMGRQSPIILVVTNKEVRDRLSKVNAEIMGTTGDPFYGAPTVVIVFADSEQGTCVENGSLVMGNLMNAAHAVGVDSCWIHLYDGSLVMGNLMLAAHSLGLGSCWIHRAKETFEREEGKAILKELGIEGDYEGIGNCVIGYAKEPAKDAAPRKTDYVHYIK